MPKYPSIQVKTVILLPPWNPQVHWISHLANSEKGVAMSKNMGCGGNAERASVRRESCDVRLENWMGPELERTCAPGEGARLHHLRVGNGELLWATCKTGKNHHFLLNGSKQSFESLSWKRYHKLQLPKNPEETHLSQRMSLSITKPSPSQLSDFGQVIYPLIASSILPV